MAPSKPFFFRVKLNLVGITLARRRRTGCLNAWTKRHTQDVAAVPPLFMSATFGLNTPAHMRARRVLLLAAGLAALSARIEAHPTTRLSGDGAARVELESWQVKADAARAGQHISHAFPSAPAAEELLQTSVGQQATRRVACTDIQRDVNAKLTALGSAATESGDCTLSSLGILSAKTGSALQQTASAAETADITARVAKECSWSGDRSAAAKSCGSESPMAIFNGMGRKYKDEAGLRSCMISQGNTTQSLHQLLLASGLMADAVCLNQGGSWCFPKVMETDLSALSIAARSTATPSKTTLDAACTPCLISYVRAYMRVTQAMAATDSAPATSAIQKQASSFELLCTKDLAGQFCMLDSELMAASRKQSALSGALLCKRGVCGMKIAHALADALPSEQKATAEQQFAAGCFQDQETGPFCAQLIKEGQPSWDRVDKDCGLFWDPLSETIATTGNTCSPACKVTFTAFADTWGCCAPTMMTFAGAELQAWAQRQSQSCGVKLRRMCNSGSALAFNVQVTNLKWLWYNADVKNKKLVSGYVAETVVQTFGVSRKLVTTTGKIMSDDGTELRVNMEFTTQTESDTVKKIFDSNYASRRAGSILSFEKMDLLPASARKNPAKKMEVVLVKGSMQAGTSSISSSNEDLKFILAGSVGGGCLVLVVIGCFLFPRRISFSRPQLSTEETLRVFYMRYAPTELKDVSEILKRYGSEESLNKALREKYGADLNTIRVRHGSGQPSSTNIAQTNTAKKGSAIYVSSQNDKKNVMQMGHLGVTTNATLGIPVVHPMSAAGIMVGKGPTIVPPQVIAGANSGLRTATRAGAQRTDVRDPWSTSDGMDIYQTLPDR